VLRNITFYATQSGIVHRLEVREGNFVKPGNQILSIAGLATVWVTADVFESDVSGIKVNDSISLVFDYLPGKVVHSKLDFIYPAVDSRVRTLRVRSTVENADGSLRPNMYAKATITLADDKQVTLVPLDAVIRTSNQNRVVLVSGPDEYKSIAIDLGRISRTEAEVLRGLNPGDEVVVHSQFLLDSESSITSDFKRMNLESTEAGDSSLRGGEADHSTMEHSAMPLDEVDEPADEKDHRTMEPSNMDMNPTDETDGNLGVHHDQ
jgi:Cu(I)/Ag(I) efflux system membrane fusion protein